MKTVLKKSKLFLPLLLVFVSSCAGLKFNQQAQDQNRQLKTLTEQTIDRSVENYADNEATTQLLADAYKSAIASEEKRGKTNYPTISMWKQLNGWINVDFVTLWKQQGKIGLPAISEIKKRANTLFDHIITLEENKIK